MNVIKKLIKKSYWIVIIAADLPLSLNGISSEFKCSVIELFDDNFREGVCNWSDGVVSSSIWFWSSVNVEEVFKLSIELTTSS